MPITGTNVVLLGLDATKMTGDEVCKATEAAMEQLDQEIAKRYDLQQDKYVENPEWLVFEDKDL